MHRYPGIRSSPFGMSTKERRPFVRQLVSVGMARSLWHRTQTREVRVYPAARFFFDTWAPPARVSTSESECPPRAGQALSAGGACADGACP